MVRSDEVGFRKPEREAYLITASQLDALPSECVFVDDLLANVEGARAAGMEAFQHQDAQSTLQRLSRLLNQVLGESS